VSYIIDMLTATAERATRPRWFPGMQLPNAPDRSWLVIIIPPDSDMSGAVHWYKEKVDDCSKLSERLRALADRLEAKI
jgi:hypothetical protein